MAMILIFINVSKWEKIAEIETTRGFQSTKSINILAIPGHCNVGQIFNMF